MDGEENEGKYHRHVPYIPHDLLVPWNKTIKKTFTKTVSACKAMFICLENAHHLSYECMMVLCYILRKGNIALKNKC